jgi:hypothetical protein
MIRPLGLPKIAFFGSELPWVTPDLLASHFEGNAAFAQQLCRKTILFSQHA